MPQLPTAGYVRHKSINSRHPSTKATDFYVKECCASIASDESRYKIRSKHLPRAVPIRIRLDHRKDKAANKTSRTSTTASNSIHIRALRLSKLEVVRQANSRLGINPAVVQAEAASLVLSVCVGTRTLGSAAFSFEADGAAALGGIASAQVSATIGICQEVVSFCNADLLGLWWRRRR
jgi:hypothetical protein